MRLINADALAEIFSDRMEKVAERYGVYSSEAGILSGAYTLLQSQHTIEPEQPQIIHCKDCKYAEVVDPEDGQDGYTCQFHRGSIWFSGSYCSWAERRQDGNNY